MSSQTEDSSKEIIDIKAQPGPQEAFLSSQADIVIFGGSAGGGKSFALLLEPLRHYENSKFGAVIFRRQSTQVRNEGGLWDESHQIYPLIGAKPKEMVLEWNFPSGSRVKFSHLEHDKTVLEYQGAQICLIGFDELTHFTESQFWYLLSRNRSTCGVKPYVRATCNADSESWVRKFIDWWIDPVTGLPIPERSGIVRYFIKSGNDILWGDSRSQLKEEYGSVVEPKSFTFIPAKLQDNKILMQKDPGYLANLMALNRVERERLLEGNWNIKPSAGNYFRREWFTTLNQLDRSHVVQSIRYWDRASTRPNETNRNPDWTVGVKISKLNTGAYVIEHVVRIRDNPLAVESLVKLMAQQDGYSCMVGLDKDPGSAGESDISHMTRLLAGFIIRVGKPTKDKITRALAFSSQCEHGNVYILKGNWNADFLMALENFPPDTTEGHDDDVDAASSGFNELSKTLSILQVL